MVLRKKLVTLLTALMLFISVCPALPTTAHAETATHTIITPFYKLVATIHGTCYIENEKLALAASVNTAGKATSAKITITLQKKDGGPWEDVISYSETGTSSANVMKSYTPKDGVLYRAKITGTVSNSSDSETVTITTSVVGL